MKNQEKKILSDLETAGEEKILEAIKLAGEVGKDSLIPVIISLALTHKSSEVVNASLDLLRSVKSKAMIPALKEAIDNANKVSDKQKLVMLCWEGTLNWDAHLGYFINLAINEPFEVALEAITVIEEMQGNINLEEAKQGIIDTEKAIAQQPDKSSLLASLAVTLKSFVSSAHLN